MLWIFIGFLLLIVFVIMALPLGGPVKTDAPDPVDFYKAQLEALSADRETMDPQDYQEAELELQRRLLSAGRDSKESPGEARQLPAKSVQLGSMLIVFTCTAGLYVWLGSPGLPEAPAPARTQFEAQIIDEQGTTLGQRIEEVASKLKRNPDDVDMLVDLATLYRQVRNFTEAALVYQNLALIQPDNVEWPLRQLEAMNVLHRGDISPGASLLVARLVEMNARHPAVHYYRGLEYKQAGNIDAARAVWLDLKSRTPEDAPWMPVLNQGLASIDPELADTPAAGRMPSAGDVATTAEDVAAMSPEDQVAFIASMIKRLEARLADNPDNSEGWLMLARARDMTGDPAGAEVALRLGIESVSQKDRAVLQAELDNR